MAKPASGRCSSNVLWCGAEDQGVGVVGWRYRLKPINPFATTALIAPIASTNELVCIQMAMAKPEIALDIVLEVCYGVELSIRVLVLLVGGIGQNPSTAFAATSPITPIASIDELVCIQMAMAKPEIASERCS